MPKKLLSKKQTNNEKSRRKSRSNNSINTKKNILDSLQFQELPPEEVDTDSVVKTINDNPSKFTKYVKMPYKKLKEIIVKNQKYFYWAFIFTTATLKVAQVVIFNLPKVIEIENLVISKYRLPQNLNEISNCSYDLNDKYFKLCNFLYHHRYLKYRLADLEYLYEFFSPLLVVHTVQSQNICFRKIYKNDKKHFESIFVSIGRFWKDQYGMTNIWYMAFIKENYLNIILEHTLLFMYENTMIDITDTMAFLRSLDNSVVLESLEKGLGFRDDNTTKETSTSEIQKDIDDLNRKLALNKINDVKIDFDKLTNFTEKDIKKEARRISIMLHPDKKKESLKPLYTELQTDFNNIFSKINILILNKKKKNPIKEPTKKPTEEQ